jgi:hypothetical protein
MKKLYRNVLFAGVLAIGVAACGDDVQVVEPTPPPPPALSVTLTPSNVTLDIGETVNLTAGITGGAAGETASWTCASSGAAITVANSASGCSVTAVAAGNATVSVTVTKGDQTSSAGAAVTVRPEEVITEAQISIAGVNQGGIPAQINNISGQLDVVINVTANDETPQRVDLLVDDVVVASQVMSTAAPAQTDEEAAAEAVQQITLSFNTAYYTIEDGVAMIRHLNGEHVISAQLTVVGLPAEPRASNTVLVNFNNADGFHVQGTLPTNSAMDSQGRRWYGGPGSGSTEITAIPVFYSGQAAQSVSVSFCGSQTSNSAPHTFSRSCAGVEAMGLVPSLTSQYAPDGAVGPTTILNTNHPFPVNIDNRAPQGGAVSIVRQANLNNRENWVNGSYSFTTGYSAPSDGGVGGVTREFRVTELGSGTVVLQGTTTAAGLANTATNQEYRLSAVVADALGNSRTINQTVAAGQTNVNGAANVSHTRNTFGFDGNAPTLTAGAGGIASGTKITLQYLNATINLVSEDVASGFAPPATGESLRHNFVRVTGTPNQPTNLNRQPIVPASGSVSSTPFATTEAGSAFITSGAAVTDYVRTPTNLAYELTVGQTAYDDVMIEDPGYYIYQARVQDKAGNQSPFYWVMAYQNAETNPQITGLTPGSFYEGGANEVFPAVASDPVELINASYDLRYAGIGRLTADRNPTTLGTKFTDMITRPYGFSFTADGFIRGIQYTDEFGRPVGDVNKPNQVRGRAYSGFTTTTTPLNPFTPATQPRHPTAFVPGQGFSEYFAAPILGDQVEDGQAFPAGTAAANPLNIGPTDIDDTEAGDGGSFGFTVTTSGSGNRALTIRARGVTNNFLNPFTAVLVVARFGDPADPLEEHFLIPLGAASANFTSPFPTRDNGTIRDYEWSFTVASNAHQLGGGASFLGVHAVGLSTGFDALASNLCAGTGSTSLAAGMCIDTP